MHETSSLKVLAYKALERLQRNNERNKRETKDENVVSQNMPCETKICPHDPGYAEARGGDPAFLQKPFLIQISSLSEEYEERIAIAEYDGQQDTIQAQRIAYQDAFISVLNALPYDDKEEKAWFEERIKAAKEWLLGQGIQCLE